MAEVREFGWNEMVRTLQTCGDDLVKDYFGRRAPLSRLIRCSVGGCTFRSFPGLNEPPSVIFREWASGALNKAVMRRLAHTDDQADFDALHEKLRADLAECWEQRGGLPLKYGSGLKLINLLLKAVVRRPKITDAQRERLIPLLHVPLDKFSLRAVRRFSNSPERVTRPVWISPTASMGFVESRKEYRRVQGVMRQVAAAAGVPPIGVDLLAWDHVHTS